MEIQLNIGLGNNPFTYEKASVIAQEILTAAGCSAIESRKDDGVYVHQEEDNVVMRFEFTDEFEWLQRKVKAIANIMNQECIAMYVPYMEGGMLLFQHEWSGEKYPFDIKYFKKF